MVIFRKKVSGLNAATLERFVLRVRRLLKLRDRVNVLMTGSSDLRGLNREFRGVDKTTDVLSFLAGSFSGNRQARIGGELAISVDIAKSNAKLLKHSLSEEVKVLILHGMLHLAGFDHENDEGQMDRKEGQLRRQLRLDSGLIERTLSAGNRQIAGGIRAQQPISSRRKRRSS